MSDKQIANHQATSVHYRTCNLCEAMCGLEIHLRNAIKHGDVEHGDIEHGNAQREAEIVAIRGDTDDPFSRGHLCPKAVALQDIYTDPDRLRHPVRRTDQGWERISWETAFDLVVEGIHGVQEQHGNDGLGIFLGNPNVHNLGSMLFTAPFNRALRTRNRYSATSTDQLPHHVAAYFLFGHPLLLPVPDIDRTQYMLIIGANPLVSNGSMMTAAGVATRLRAIQSRGGRVVVLDPRRTESAAAADEHHFVRPGRDVFLLLSMLQTIFHQGLIHPEQLPVYVDGLDALRQITMNFPPAVTAPLTGIPAQVTERLARDFCAADGAVAYGRMGASTQQFGGMVQWLINVLNIITGNLDRSGGSMFTTPAVDVVALTGGMAKPGRMGQWHSRVRGLPSFGGELPAAALAEEMATPGPGQIRGLITMAGNPVLSTPGGAQLDELLPHLDFMAAIDIYVNETTRHADVILPPTCGLESAHYDLLFHNIAVRNTAKYSPPLLPAADDTRHDWQILGELHQRLEARRGHQPPTGKSRDPFQRLSPQGLLDLALRFGPHGLWHRQGRNGAGLTLAKVKRAPHGIDLGPLQPVLPQRLFTADKRIDLTAGPFLDQVRQLQQRLETERSAASPSPAAEQWLHLIGRRHLRSNNSWMHNSPRLLRGKPRCTLLIHPHDAARFAVTDGALVDVHSRVGVVRLPAEVSEEMMPGVVSIPHGWGHDRPGVHLQVAAAQPGVSINDLTDPGLIDELTGNAAFSGVPVQIKPAIT